MLSSLGSNRPCDNGGGGLGQRFRGGKIGIMENNELEEGEAYAGSDHNYDPDVALSYLDIKLQDVLGHFQKEFEGGVSAENLGAKYGGYGSFLPTQHRSPSVLLQSGAQAAPQNNPVTKSSHEFASERTRSTVCSGSNIVHCAPGNLSNVSAHMNDDIALKKDTSKFVAKCSREDSPLKKDTVSKNTTVGDQMKLKLKFKRPSESFQRNRNSALYSELGLKNSPSPSPELSPDRGPSSLPQNDLASALSPMTIVKIMQSYEIPEGSLLSPFPQYLLKVPEQFEKTSGRENLKGRVKAESGEAPSVGKEEIESGNKSQCQKERGGSFIENRKKCTEVKTDSGSDLARARTSSLNISSTLYPKNSYQEPSNGELVATVRKESTRAHDMDSDAAKGIFKEKTCKADPEKNEILVPDKSRQSDKLINGGSGSVAITSRSSYKLKVSSQGKETKDGGNYKISKLETKKVSQECYKDHKNNEHVSKKLSVDTYRDKISGKDLDETAPLGEKGKDHITHIKKRQRDVHPEVTSSKEVSKVKCRNIAREARKDLKSDKYAKEPLMCDASAEGMKGQRESKSIFKNYQRDRPKEGQAYNDSKKDGDPYHKESVREVRYGLADKTSARVLENEEKGRGPTKSSSFKKMDHVSNEAYVSIPSTQQPAAGMVGAEVTPAPQPYVVIDENWVQCDRCNQWRLLPFGREAPASKKWLCSMLDWLPNMNSCEIPEEATTDAVYASYGMQPPHQGQVDANKDCMLSACLPTDAVAGSRLMVTNCAATANLPISSSRKDKQSSLKSKSLNNMAQHSVEKLQVSKGMDHLMGVTNKQKQTEKTKLKQNFWDEGWDGIAQGNVSGIKVKHRSDADLDVQKSFKKMKPDDGDHNVGKNAVETNSYEKTGSSRFNCVPVKPAIGKVKRYVENTGAMKEARGSHTTMKEQTSLDTDSRGTFSSFDTERHSNKGISAKKRKLKDQKDTERIKENHADGEHNEDCQNFDKDIESETECQRGKKVKHSKVEGKETNMKKASSNIEIAHGSDMMASQKYIVSERGEERSHGVAGNVEKPKKSGVARIITSGTDVLKKEVKSSVAAASSSSKMSCSHKSKPNINDQRGSPGESVSSSPYRFYKVEKQSQGRKDFFGADDTMDSDFDNATTSIHHSDGDEDIQSDHSVPPRKAGKLTMHDGLQENAIGYKSSSVNMANTEEKYEKGIKHSSDVKFKHGKCNKKVDRSNADTDTIGAGQTHTSSQKVSSLPEKHDRYSTKQKDRDHFQGKYADSQNSNASHVKSTKDSIVRDHDCEKNRNSNNERGKEKTHDGSGESHDFLMNGRDSGSRRHEVVFEGHSQSLYSEAARGLKEVNKYANESNKDKNSTLIENAKNESKAKKTSEGRKGSRSKLQKNETAEIQVSESNNKPNKDSSTQQVKHGGSSLKDGKSGSHQNTKQGTLVNNEKASGKALLSGGSHSSVARNKGKSQAIPNPEGKADSRAHSSGVGASAQKGIQDGFSVDACGTELLSAKENCDGLSTKATVGNGHHSKDLEVAVASPAKREPSQISGNAILKEATDLKHTADRMMGNGVDEFEATCLYFEAALKFLLAASVLESNNPDNARHGETMLSMKLYTETAQLCKFCASQFERLKEMSAAALAYKCMAVAHMRVVLFKTSDISRDRQELQAPIHSVFLGESPSSSASDVDNLNNHALMDKSHANTAKVEESLQGSVHHIIPARQLPYLRRVVQYTSDAIAAMEASRKSENAFAVAAKHSDANNRRKEIPAVRTVIDFSFLDIDGFLRLVRVAMKALHH